MSSCTSKATWGGGSVGYKLVLSSFLILPLQVMLFSNGQQLPFPQVRSVLLSKDVPREKTPSSGFLILKALSHPASQMVCQEGPQI